MNRNEFLAAAKVGRHHIQANQEGAKGYFLSMVVPRGEGEDPDTYTLEIDGLPRYFKSLRGVEGLLKEAGIFAFSVVMAKSAIAKAKRKPAPKEKAGK